jgi:prophage regulatory protein
MTKPVQAERNGRMNHRLGDGRETLTRTSPTTALAPHQRILRLREVCALTGLRRSFIYQLQADGRFPQRIKLGARAVGWLEDEVQQWVGDRIAESRSSTPVPGTSG